MYCNLYVVDTQVSSLTHTLTLILVPLHPHPYNSPAISLSTKVHHSLGFCRLLLLFSAHAAPVIAPHCSGPHLFPSTLHRTWVLFTNYLSAFRPYIPLPPLELERWSAKIFITHT